jgi:hypothetical protein
MPMLAIDERQMTIRQLAASIVIASAVSLPLSAQERNRSLERISLELEKPAPSLGMPIVEPPPGAPQLGPFTLETPQFRGEIIRLSLPVGEYASRVARGISAANRRRQEAAARRRVEADVKAFAKEGAPKTVPARSGK